jgi:DnaJ-class molecular chaperone
MNTIANNGPLVRCPDCNGAGEIKQPENYRGEFFLAKHTCSLCGGQRSIPVSIAININDLIETLQSATSCSPN